MLDPEVRKYVDDRCAELVEQFGRGHLGGHEHDRRLDCIRCGQNLAIQDRQTGEVRGGYRGDWAIHIVPTTPFTIACKRCRCMTRFSPQGEPLEAVQLAG